MAGTSINLVMGDEIFRQLFLEVEDLSKGSEFERKAIEIYVEVALRKAFNLVYDEALLPDLSKVCAEELKKAIPNASDQELETMSNTRVEAIKRLTDKLVQRASAIMDAFVDKLENHIMTEFTSALNEKYSDANIDLKIDKYLFKRPESFQKALFELVYGKDPAHKSDLQRFLQKKKEFEGGA
jgi:arsenate reductase-like glutaredoxin family protein